MSAGGMMLLLGFPMPHVIWLRLAGAKTAMSSQRQPIFLIIPKRPQPSGAAITELQGSGTRAGVCPVCHFA